MVQQPTINKIVVYVRIFKAFGGGCKWYFRKE